MTRPAPERPWPRFMLCLEDVWIAECAFPGQLIPHADLPKIRAAYARGVAHAMRSTGLHPSEFGKAPRPHDGHLAWARDPIDTVLAWKCENLGLREVHRAFRPIPRSLEV